MEILSLSLGFLSVVLAIVLPLVLNFQTNKVIKSEDERAKILISETQKMIEEGNKRTQEMIEEGRKETRELIKFITSLIKVDGEKTRELIKKVIKE